MTIIKLKQSHIWDRDPHDWYVEPHECSAALFDMEIFSGPVWDPACGLGRIVQSAKNANLEAFGSDIIKRSDYCEFQNCFLETSTESQFNNIVSNPPFSLAEKFVQRALQLVPSGGKVAMILPIVWLSGFSSKRKWLPDSPMVRFFPISPRPSMPPGKIIEAGVKAGNGTKDFAWFVWEKGYQGTLEVIFMNTKTYKKGYNPQQIKLVV